MYYFMLIIFLIYSDFAFLSLLFIDKIIIVLSCLSFTMFLKAGKFLKFKSWY